MTYRYAFIPAFVRANEAITSWVAKSDKSTIGVALNTTEKNIKTAELLSEHSKIVWPSRGMVQELNPMDLLVYDYE